MRSRSATAAGTLPKYFFTNATGVIDLCTRVRYRDTALSARARACVYVSYQNSTPASALPATLKSVSITRRLSAHTRVSRTTARTRTARTQVRAERVAQCAHNRDTQLSRGTAVDTRHVRQSPESRHALRGVEGAMRRHRAPVEALHKRRARHVRRRVVSTLIAGRHRVSTPRRYAQHTRHREHTHAHSACVHAGGADGLRRSATMSWSRRSKRPTLFIDARTAGAFCVASALTSSMTRTSTAGAGSSSSSSVKSACRLRTTVSACPNRLVGAAPASTMPSVPGASMASLLLDDVVCATVDAAVGAGGDDCLPVVRGALLGTPALALAVAGVTGSARHGRRSM
jgi:hypothetical protein